jgi:uridine monophosphate synthetase
MEKGEIAAKLVDAGAIKFGSFTMKSGRTSPYYIDLRVLPSHPDVLMMVGRAIAEMIASAGIKIDRLCGIPLAGISIATATSIESNIPAVYTRKEPTIYRELVASLRKMAPEVFNPEEMPAAEKLIGIIEEMGGSKSHGIKRLVDGELRAGDRIGIIDDVVTNAASKLEARELVLAEAEKRGIDVKSKEIFVLIDRQEGGREALEKEGMRLFAVMTAKEMADALKSKGKITGEQYGSITEYLSKWE